MKKFNIEMYFSIYKRKTLHYICFCNDFLQIWEVKSKMRIDRVKLIAEMARQDLKIKDLASKACVSCCTVTALRSGKSCTENSVRRVAAALGVSVEDLKED